MEGVGGNFYSPELSTDFLELPQSLHEQWNYYRFFYRTEPFVGQGVSTSTPSCRSVRSASGWRRPKDREIAVKATRFCETLGTTCQPSGQAPLHHP